MKDQDIVCRVCSARDTILLELFGPQSKTYAADVNKCLSVEVSEGDGLPSKICIKCVGLLSDCRPFVEKVLELTEEKNRKSTSETECHFCLSSENCLFPIPAVSIAKTKDCFDIDVLASHQICHKCQFHLESIHELKQKALATLKTYFARSLTPKKERNQSASKIKSAHNLKVSKNLSEDADSVSKKQNCEKNESVHDMVNKLRQRYKMGEDESHSVKVKIVDIKLIIGPEFLSKGTINVTEFLQKLNPSSISSEGVVSRRGRKKSSLSTVKASNIKSESVATNFENLKKSQSVAHEKVSRSWKRSRESSETDLDQLLKRSHCENGNEDASRPGEVNDVAEEGKKYQKRKKGGIRSDDSINNADGENEKEEPKSTREVDESVYDGVENDGLKDNRTEDYDSSGISNRLNGDKENGKDPRQVDESVDEGQENKGQKLKRKKRRGNNANYSKYFDENDDKPQPIIRRKRKDSEEEYNESSIYKGKKRRWDPSHSSEDQAGEPSTTDNAEQPEYLKEMDELLKFTPKLSFRPFICSVCHEGYVSTVKGKLHKLMVHDPQSKNISLMLKRCDDDPEMEKLKERLEKEKLERVSLPQEIPCDSSEKESIGDIIDDDDSLNEDVNKTHVSDNSKEDDKSKGDDKSKDHELCEAHDSDDDLFAGRAEVKRPETTNAFEELLKSTSTNEKKDQESVDISAAEKEVDKVSSPLNNFEEKNCGEVAIESLSNKDGCETNKKSKDGLPNEPSKQLDRSMGEAMESEDVAEREPTTAKDNDSQEGEKVNETEVRTENTDNKAEEKMENKAKEKTGSKEEEKTENKEEETEKKEEEETKNKAKEKTENKKEEKTESKEEEKTENKSEEKTENEAEEKTENEAEEKTGNEAEQKPENEAEEKTENEAEEKMEIEVEEKTENEVEQRPENEAEQAAEKETEQKTENEAEEKPSDGGEKNDAIDEDNLVIDESEEKESLRAGDQSEVNVSETEHQGKDEVKKDDEGFKETNAKHLENGKEVSNEMNQSISHENQGDSVELCTQSIKEKSSVRADNLLTNKQNNSPDFVESDEDRHADVESNGDSGERSEDEKDCPEEHPDHKVQAARSESTCNSQENESAAGIIAVNN